MTYPNQRASYLNTATPNIVDPFAYYRHVLTFQVFQQMPEPRALAMLRRRSLIYGGSVCIERVHPGIQVHANPPLQSALLSMDQTSRLGLGCW